MTEEKYLANWSQGINNMAPKDRVPENYVHDALNVDFISGKLSSRIGYEKVSEATNARAIMSVGNKLVWADGPELKARDLRTNAEETLQTIAGAGPVCGTTFNSELFISTATETLRYDGNTLRPWGVATVLRQPAVTITNQRSGRRLYAATFVDSYGDEGGTVAAANVPDGDYEFELPEPPPGGKVRIYVSALNGRTMYLQDEKAAAATVNVYRPVDDSEPLTTMHMREPPVGAHFLDSIGGVILFAIDTVVGFTAPLSPHITSPESAFFQYPERVNLMAAGFRAVYVGADKCYALVNVETPDPRQTTTFDYPAVSGTGTILPDGRAAWMTRYGMAIESTDPREGVVQVTRGAFVPQATGDGASGVVENNGTSMVVTTMRNPAGDNALASSDYFEAEVIRP